MIIQFCGLSGAGKTTLAALVQKKLQQEGVAVEIIDGDVYRETLCRDLAFSREDRTENILRLAFVASRLSAHGVVSIISAINPYEATRSSVASRYAQVKTVYIDCPLSTLIERDTKGLYRKALLPDGHPEKVANLTGINDPFETPTKPDLHLNTAEMGPEPCATLLANFVFQHLPPAARHRATAAARSL